ncbi:MAG: site-specific integrase [Gammaproteobacteria bacterium]|nr:site-specific integrase [Gammaproteobacteria bacterium]
MPSRGLEEVLLLYLDVAEHSAKDLKSAISKASAIRPYIEGKHIKDAPAVAQAMRNAMLGKVLPATINRRLALLRRLCRLAHEAGWIAQPPIIKLLPGEVERQFYLTPKEIEQIASRMPIAGDAVRIAGYTGLRRSELLGLRPENIKGDLIVLQTSKNGRPRIIPIPKAVAHIKLPLKITEGILRKEWEVARDAVKLAHIRFHDLRHSYASMLVAAGANDRALGELLGHKSASMVRRYAHLREETLRDIVGKIGTGSVTAKKRKAPRGT